MGASTPSGWWGKVAMLGDFASRRLPPEWVARADAWISAGIAASRADLGDAWVASYLRAPTWRFALPAGLIDGQWWFGLLMPSCDNAGRYFPLLLAQPRAQPPQGAVALAGLDAWWGAAATVMWDTLADGASLDAFEHAVAALPRWDDIAPPAATTLQGAPSGRERHAVRGDASAAEVLAGLAGHAFTQRIQGCSLWWPLDTSGECGTCTLAPGLPEGEDFTLLLTGHW